MKAKSRSLASLLVLAAVGAMVLAGCGGGSSSSSSSGDGSSSDFVSGAEAACRKANGAIIALGTPQQEQVTRYLEETEELLERLHKEISALDPAGAAETAYVEGLSKAIPELTKMTNAARNENFDAVRELSAALVEIKLGELAEAAKLKSCAEVPVSES
jgi:hypothetical protein